MPQSCHCPDGGCEISNASRTGDWLSGSRYIPGRSCGEAAASRLRLATSELEAFVGGSESSGCISLAGGRASQIFKISIDPDQGSALQRSYPKQWVVLGITVKVMQLSCEDLLDTGECHVHTKPQGTLCKNVE
jgi:hypothetical protein